jgi:hypothetical protein
MRAAVMPVLMLVCSCLVPLAAETRPDVPVLRDAKAMLRISDAQWLDHQVAQLAAACGQDPAPARERMSRTLFLCNSTAGIDLQRPALIAWREGRSPMVAIIPVGNRRAFLDSFGAMPPGEPPLVRVGDREGTVIFSQVRPGLREEYRLLVSDNTAYLARSAEECRQLAEHPLARSGDDFALGFSAWGPFTGELPFGVAIELPSVERLHVPDSLQALLTALRGRLAETLPQQIAEWSWRIERDSKAAGGVWSASLQAVPDSPLSEWLRAQSNQAMRVGAALPPEDMLRVVGQFTWQGQGDETGHALVARVKDAAGDGWTPVVDEAWRALWPLADRVGAFALGVQLTPEAAVPTLIVEHPQPDLLAAHSARVLAALSGGAPSQDAALPGWKLPNGTALAIGERQVAAVSAGDASAAGAQATIARIASAAPTDAQPGVLLASLDLTQIVVEEFKDEDRIEPETQLPPVTVRLLARVAHDELQAQCTLPIADAAALLSKVRWK